MKFGNLRILFLLFAFCSSTILSAQGEFPPTEYANLKLWLRSDSVELNVTQDRVVQMYDMSGNNNHAIQSNPVQQPLYVTSNIEINNRPSLSFDGTDDYFPGTGSFGSITKYTFFAIVRINARKSYNWVYRNAPTGTGFSFGLSGQGDGKFRYWPHGTSNSVVFDPIVPNLEYHIYGLKSSNDSSIVTRYFFDGTQTGTTNNLVTTHAANGYTVGTLNNGVQALDGEIVEIILYDRYMTSDEQFEIENYLRERYFPSEYIAPIDIDDIYYDYGFCDTTLSVPDIYTNYLWSNGSTTFTATYNQPGTHWVEATNIHGYVDRDTFEIFFPEIGLTIDTLFCPGEQKTWSANLGSDYTYEWSTMETTESIDIGTTGNYFVTVTDTNGCQSTSETLFFDEDPYPATVSLGPDIDLCSGNSIGLVGGAAETVSYLWSTTETTPTINIATTDTYTVQTENANGCVATDDILVTIVGDAPVVQIGMDPSYCQFEEFVFVDNSFTTDGSTITDWSWDLGDATVSTDETGSHAYVSHGQVTVQLTVTTDAGCENVGDMLVDVYQKPIIDFNTTNVCQSDPINFYSNQSTLPFITNWMWNFDDPASGSENTATGEITAHVFETSGDFDVELMAEDVNGCRDTVVQTVSILPTPQVDFTFNEVCVGQTVNFTNQTTIEDPYLIASTQWQLGGGATSSQFSPSRLYITAGTFNITLTVTANNGCVQQLTQPLKIHAQPEPDYTFSPSCAGLPTVFTDASVVPDGSVSFVTWQFNANNPVNGDVVSHSFTNPGTQQVRQIVVSDFGCQFTEISNIETNPELSADFSVASNLILAGAPTLFQNESIGAETYEWEIGGFYSGTDESPELTIPLENIGDTVNVVLIASNSFGCSDTLRVDLVIYEARTDLAITQVFTYTNPDGYISLGAELTNMGSSTITKADLYLRMSESSPSKGTWEGELGAGEKEIYLFPVSPYQSAESENINDQYICVEGRIVLPAGLIDEVPANNEFCRNMAEEEAIILIPYPNPVSNELTIRVIMPANQTVDIQIFDAAGKLVYTVVNNGELSKGLNTFTINVNNWSEGSYTIFMQNNGIRKTVRFVKS